MQNDRAFARRKADLTGKILAPSASFWEDCSVVNISETGALVSAPLAQVPPARLYLWQARTSVLFECEVRWQRAGMLGLRFVGAHNRASRLELLRASAAAEPTPKLAA